MKYLIGDIPYEWLEEEEKGKCQYISYLEIAMLVYQDDVWSTEKDYRSSWENQLLYLVFISSWRYEEAACKDKEGCRYDPEYWWENNKCDIANEGRESENHTRKEDWIFILGRIHPEPQTKEHKEVK